MCIAVPMQVETCAEGWALCNDGGDHDRRERVDVRLVGQQRPGTWLLVFLGAARDVIDEQRARQTRDALEALRAVQQGESVEHLFANLIGREPELPTFLQPQLEPGRDA
ncbi:MAG: HypC/HybG/HupF family hydrogenase formation chaperone [Thiohalocapsa sp.]